MTDKVKQVIEKVEETGHLSRLNQLTAKEIGEFCSFLVGYGANFYTMRDKLLYRERLFNAFEVVGLQSMIQEYDSSYQGEISNFWNTLTEKSRFVKYMMEHGGIGRTSCYSRFSAFNFKPWELIGLEQLLTVFLEKK